MFQRVPGLYFTIKVGAEFVPAHSPFSRHQQTPGATALEWEYISLDKLELDKYDRMPKTWSNENDEYFLKLPEGFECWHLPDEVQDLREKCTTLGLPGLVLRCSMSEAVEEGSVLSRMTPFVFYKPRDEEPKETPVEDAELSTLERLSSKVLAIFEDKAGDAVLETPQLHAWSNVLQDSETIAALSTCDTVEGLDLELSKLFLTDVSASKEDATIPEKLKEKVVDAWESSQPVRPDLIPNPHRTLDLTRTHFEMYDYTPDRPSGLVLETHERSRFVIGAAKSQPFWTRGEGFPMLLQGTVEMIERLREGESQS